MKGDVLLRCEILYELLVERSNFQTDLCNNFRDYEWDIHINYLKTYLIMFKPTAKGGKIRFNITTKKCIFILYQLKG